MYDLIPATEEGVQGGEVNALDANPVVEPAATNSEQEGKPWSMSYFSKLCNYAITPACAFKLQELFETLVAYS